MIKLAILDDNTNQLDCINNKVSSILKNRNIAFKIDLYSDIDSLKSTLLDINYDIYILDIQIDKTTSIPLANSINSINENGQIIFVTSYSDYFKDVYACKHVYCLLKDEIDNRLTQALDKAIDNLTNKKTYNLAVKSNHKTVIIKADDIIYLEKSLRKIKFNLKDKSIIETYASFDEYIDKLPSSFIQVHRSFIINPAYIKNIGHTTITLLNDVDIPVSNSFRKNKVIDKLLNEYFN